VQVDSEHFVIVTDLDRADAIATARQLEQGFDAIAKVAFVHPRTTVEPTTVVIFRGDSDFHTFLPPMAGAAFSSHWHNDPEGRRILIAQGMLTEENRFMFFHELTHDLVHLNFGAAPPWLQEGWAEYYSTVHVNGAKAIVGEAPRQVTFTEESDYQVYRDKAGAGWFAIPIRDVPSATELMRMDRSAFYLQAFAEDPTSEETLATERHYVAAWALVHMLLDGPAPYPERFGRFMQEANEGKALEVALREAFGDLPPGQLDLDFRRYLAKRDVAIWSTHYERPSKPLGVSTRYLADAEVHLLWGLLASWAPATASVGERELDTAIDAAPSWPDAMYYRGVFAIAQGRLDEAQRRISTALTKSPNDSRFLLGLLFLKIVQQQKTKSKDVAGLLDVAVRLSRVANNATELNAAADTLRGLSHAQDALPLAERAVALAPFDPAVLDTLANVLFDLGRAREAVAVQTAAVSFLDEHTQGLGIEKRLARYKAAAAAQ
jgi:tetratricopeptide (TPR) repeat protein